MRQGQCEIRKSDKIVHISQTTTEIVRIPKAMTANCYSGASAEDTL